VAKPGRGGELLTVLEELATATRAEPGNDVFVVHAARDEPDAVLGYEVFRGDEALAAHRATDAVRIAQERLGDVLADPPEIRYAT
jgi:quinol monooxygenase YgiN